MDCSPLGSSVHGISLGKNTGVGCHFLFQGIFPSQDLDPHLLHWQADSLPLRHQGSQAAMWNMGPRGPGGQQRGLPSGLDKRRQRLGPGQWQWGGKQRADSKGLVATVDVG